jgi:hypothetical protein
MRRKAGSMNAMPVGRVKKPKANSSANLYGVEECLRSCSAL